MELCSSRLSSGWKIFLCNAILKSSLGETKIGHLYWKLLVLFLRDIKSSWCFMIDIYHMLKKWITIFTNWVTDYVHKHFTVDKHTKNFLCLFECIAVLQNDRYFVLLLHKECCFCVYLLCMWTMQSTFYSIRCTFYSKFCILFTFETHTECVYWKYSNISKKLSIYLSLDSFYIRF